MVAAGPRWRGPATRRAAAGRPRGRRARRPVGGARPPRSASATVSRSRSRSTSSWTCWCGWPSSRAAWSAATSWRETTSRSAASRASASSSPRSRTASGMWYAALASSSRLRNHSRCCAHDSGHERGPLGRGDGAAGAAGVAGTARGELRDGGCLEERADAQLHTELGADPADEAGREQRVAAEVEEARRRPRRARRGRARRRQTAASVRSASVPGLEASRRGGAVGRGQRVAVDLAVGGEREARRAGTKAAAPCSRAGRRAAPAQRRRLRRRVGGGDVGRPALVAGVGPRATTTAARAPRLRGSARPRSRRARCGSRGS